MSYVHVPARPHQLCEMCNKICLESRLIRNIPELYAERDEKDLDLDEIKEDKQQFKFQSLDRHVHYIQDCIHGPF